MFRHSNNSNHRQRRRSGAVREQRVWIVLLCFGWVMLALTGVLAEQEKVDEHKMMSVFIYSFGKYTTWPDSAYPEDEEDLVIGVFGESPVIEHLNRVAAKRKLHKRKIRVLHFNDYEDYETSQMVFVSGDLPKSEQRRIISKLRREPTLLIGETSEFNDNGGNVSFFLTEDFNVKFEIAPENTKQSGLVLDAKLLKLSSKRPLEPIAIEQPPISSSPLSSQPFSATPIVP